MTPESLQLNISAAAFMDEAEAVQRLLADLALLKALEVEIHADAMQLAQTLREKGAGTGVEAFLHEYGLDTREGVAIMCLAEALLRIPDAETADRLIHGTFAEGQWGAHMHSGSLFVNASSWGLLLTGKVVHLTDGGNILQRTAARLGDPVIREALKAGMRFIGSQFVMGEDIRGALARSKTFAKEGYRFSFDMLGEGARSDAQAKAYVESYLDAIAAIGEEAKGKPLYEAPGISVKLSALHARYQFAQKDRVMAELLPRLKKIVLAAKQNGITVAIDAEESTRLDIEMQLFAALFTDADFAGWEGLGFVLQAYQKRAYALVDFLVALSRKAGRRMPLRLVKGAYWDSEIKWAQLSGLSGYPVFTRKEHTDVSYLACADKMLRNLECFYPQFATHNARTVASIRVLAKKYGAGAGAFEVQRLHGMGEKLHSLLLPGMASRIYAPVGRHKDLLAYLIRRLLENGANTSFVNLLMDTERPIDELVADPVPAAAHQGTPNPLIPLPRDMYGTRKNSSGLDFGNLAEMENIRAAIKPFTSQPLTEVAHVTPEKVEAAIAAAAQGAPAWANVPVTERSGILEKAADLLEANKPELMSLLVRESGKTLPDANAEVREAADFCRYYAHHARLAMAEERLTGPTGESNALLLYPRGVFACISPWNFPLAIFMGQIVAALATGNCALAKPAEQTPRIAARAVELLHQAGVPRAVLQLLPGRGSVVGAALTADPRVSGIVFTGGTDTAQKINQTLAARPGPIVPLIAETGGQNCMVVDSSALLEQAVDDIVLSAFGSAGQRCSCLRVLFVQEEIADELLTLLAGAMQELRLGDPSLLSTDIGPVIDAEAKQALEAHILAMKHSARFIAAAPLPNTPGNFVAPHAFEIPTIGVLEREVFGPILHVVRFRAGAMQAVADAINATGYGLTFGMQSRIQSNIDFFTARICAGNLYINRSMIGATVGVQPFGGEGLSGTGPKAGGPHYLLRFVTERTRTVNTAAIGGNLELLSGGGMISALLFFYYIAESLGLWLCGMRLLQRLPLFKRTPAWILFLLSIGLFPVLVTYGGYAGIFRLTVLPEIIGVAAAWYLMWELFSRRGVIAGGVTRFLQHGHGLAFFALGLVFLAVHLVSHFCYFSGGVNNWPWDELRGLSFTSAFAANYLKPAHPLDLSIPISYSYYLFEYTAFLYSSVNGYGWPVLTMLVASSAAIAGFYFAFFCLLCVLLPRAGAGTMLFGLLAITFFGLDFLRYEGTPNGTIDWWNPVQITNMASQWNYVYHYLSGMAFFMAAAACLIGALANKRKDLLVAGAALSCFSITFAMLSGVFFMLVTGLSALLFAAARPSRLQWALKFVPLLLLLAAFILLPQLFAFVGRDGYMHISPPVLWFSRVPVQVATFAQWREFFVTLFIEIGPVLLLGLLATPLYIAAHFRTSPFASIFMSLLMVGTVVAAMCVEAGSGDWLWRSCGFSILIFSAVSAAWVYSLWQPCQIPLRCAKGTAALLLLMPGLWNFYLEQHMRYASCSYPPPGLAEVNQQLDLHTPAASVPFPPSWIFSAGRIAIQPANDTWGLLGVYSLPKEFLMQYFHRSGDVITCGATWFGPSVPDKKFANIIATSPLKISYTECKEAPGHQ